MFWGSSPQSSREATHSTSTPASEGPRRATLLPKCPYPAPPRGVWTRCPGRETHGLSAPCCPDWALPVLSQLLDPLTGGPWRREQAQRLLPAVSRGPPGSTHSTAQWGREGRLLGAGLQSRSPTPALLSSDPHTWRPLQGPGHLEDVTQRRGPPSEAGCTPAGRGGPLLTQSPAPPLRSPSLGDRLPWSGPQHTETHLLLPHLLSQDPPRGNPIHPHRPAAPLLSLAPPSCTPP